MTNHTSSEHIRLRELGKSKFEVAKNEADIRGWAVKNGLGRVVGNVSDLLFDIESEKVLYMVLDLEGNELYLKDRKVLAPLHIAEIHEGFKNVIFPGLLANELTSLPTYEKGKVSTRIEDMVQHAFSSSQGTERMQEQSTFNTNTSNSNSEQNHLINNTYSEPRQSSHDSEKPRPQTVVGVFEHSNQGQVAIEYLLDQNFKRNQIEVSGRNPHSTSVDDDHSISNWFKSVFGNDNDAKTYSDAAKTGCVITIQTASMEEAERAAEILDNHGALNINDSSVGQHQNFKSRILDRKEATSRWTR